MIEKIGNQEFEFDCKLRTTIKIKKAFNKPFNDVMRGLGEMDTMDLIKLLYTGIDSEKVKKEDFEDVILDNLGNMELIELVERFIMKIQYPGLEIDEIEAKIDEKNKKAQALGIS